MMRQILVTTALACMVCSGIRAQQTLEEGVMPQLPAFPEIPAPLPVGSVKMGDCNEFAEVQLDIPGLRVHTEPGGRAGR
ncbi:MAG: hypothetical protein K2H04_09115, partial [Bacteroidaceae bacterium]|nr:hypothetical protein [Bacteroidaceae bacterium]